MSPRVRILTVANHLGARGGLERTQLTNCRELAARGHRVDLVYVTRGRLRPGVGTVHRPRWRRPTGHSPVVGTRSHPPPGCSVPCGPAAGLEPDVLYVYRYWDIPYAVAVGLLVGSPVVFHLCLPPPEVVPRWLRPFLGRVDRTLSVSRDTASRWEGTGLQADRVSVALTGIDLDRYVPAAADERASTRRRLGIAEDAFVVLYAGRIGREKGVDVLVRAFAQVAARRPGSRLVVVGSPSLGADPADSARYEAELRELADGLAVTWLAAQPDVARAHPGRRCGGGPEPVARTAVALGHGAAGVRRPGGGHARRRQSRDPRRLAVRLPGGAP